ncbi:MAG: hypothetical protein ABI609_12275 [Acidobacteriota bacterium]
MQRLGTPRIVAVVLLGLSSISIPSFAESLGCVPGSRPVIEARGFFSSTLPPDPGEIPLPERREALQVCQDHRLLGSIFLSALGAQQPEYALITSGRITADSWAELSAASRAAKIGLLQNCRVDTPSSLTVEIELTWHGAGTRVNKFQLSSSNQALPACPTAVYGLWQALFGVDLDPGAAVVVIP